MKFLRNHLNRIISLKKTDVYYFDEIGSLDIIDLKDYGPENNKAFRYVLVVLDNFAEFGRTVLLNNESAQTKKRHF